MKRNMRIQFNGNGNEMKRECCKTHTARAIEWNVSMLRAFYTCIRWWDGFYVGPHQQLQYLLHIKFPSLNSFLWPDENSIRAKRAALYTHTALSFVGINCRQLAIDGRRWRRIWTEAQSHRVDNISAISLHTNAIVSPTIGWHFCVRLLRHFMEKSISNFFDSTISTACVWRVSLWWFCVVDCGDRR